MSLVFALTVGACRGEELPVPPTDFDPSLGVDISRMDQTDTGLFIEVLNKGRGTPAGDSAKIYIDYKGYLPDGKQFDTNQGQGPLLVTLGKDFLIDGLMEGMQGMREGEERLLVIPPSLGYGETGDLGYVPRNTWLVFRVRRLADAAPTL